MNIAELVLAIVRGAMELVKLADKAREQLRQTHEWTAEQDAAFDAHLTDLFNAEHWALTP